MSREIAAARADQFAQLKGFYEDRGTGAERLVSAMTCLERWVRGGVDLGQRSFKVSDDGVHETKLPWSVELTNKHSTGERGERCYGASLGDALAQAAMVVGCDAELAADYEEAT